MIDTLKTRALAGRLGNTIAGTIINRASSFHCASREEVEKTLGKVIAEIPECPEVHRETAEGSPVVLSAPDADASRAIKRLAAELVGEGHEEELRF